MIVVIVMMFCMVLVAVGAYLYLNQSQEGDECEGKDENGNYEIDADGKCVLKSCKSGYIKSGKECLVDQSGEECEPEGIKDPKGTYLTNRMGDCEKTCITGYSDTDGLCTRIDAGPHFEKGPDTCQGPSDCPPNLYSENGWYHFVMQQDGNLVLYDAKNPNDSVPWNTGTHNQGTGPYRLVLQGDNNLVVYDSLYAALWNTGTQNQGTGPLKLVVQNDRNVVLYDANDEFIWSTDTAVA